MKIRSVVAPLLVVGTAIALSLGTVSPASAAPTRVTGAAQTQATVIVPDEVGKNVGIAIDDLLAAGFRLGFKEYKDNNCSYDRWQVIRQSPAAGSSVPEGSVVTLTFAVWPAAPAQCP
ncbi:PASTA domain-containing protein [Kineosporia succinea]|uniref:Beta-lactam-binding protein with PASTA domain n=1 Tax=Kineosporia succinea TaxID=84632 RepID=A0ABT9P5B2_9ACTN|nr:PASTA domain-containing protein [Kineosporia succinea]MDP9827872.1 beta-lactam-binding protein with PASTA domain [Kineosporia succinea]